MDGSLDTNVVLRLLVGDIPAQTTRARRLLDASRSLHVADIVFVELEYALRTHYGLDRPSIAHILLAFSTLPVIDCNRDLLAAVLSIYPDHPALSFTDICLATHAAHHDATPLYSFDRKLARQMPSVKSL